MHIADLVQGNEQHEAYGSLMVENMSRYRTFLESIIRASLDVERPFLSSAIIKALNYHAIIGLHDNAGAYRSMAVEVVNRNGEVTFTPPPHFQLQSLMDDCVNLINWKWQSTDFIELAAWSLWRINHIHPFVNGNGRAARAVCYFILCVKVGGVIPGDVDILDLLVRDRDSYINALRDGDQGNLVTLENLLKELLLEQLRPTITQ